MFAIGLLRSGWDDLAGVQEAGERRLVEDRHADYLEREEAVVPPTFLTTAIFWQPPEAAALIRDIGLDPHRVLHGEQEYVFPGVPPRAGARLHARTVVEEIYDKEGKRGGRMTFVVTRTDFTDDDGFVVAQQRSTAIETGRPPVAPTEPQGD